MKTRKRFTGLQDIYFDNDNIFINCIEKEGSIVNIYVRDDAMYMDPNGMYEALVHDVRIGFCYVVLRDVCYNKVINRKLKIKTHPTLIPHIGDVIRVSMDLNKIFIINNDFVYNRELEYQE